MHDQDVETVAVRLAGGIGEQFELDRRAIRGDAEGLLELGLQELQRARRVPPGILDRGIEFLGVGQQVVDADVDERDGVAEELERLELAQEVGQRPQAREDLVEADLVELEQIAELG